MNKIAIFVALCAVPVLVACNNGILPEPPELRRGSLPVASVTNIRDLGGLAGYGGATLKWGLLIRSGDLDMLSARDRNFLFGHDGMGIGTVVDFRSGEWRLHFGGYGDGLEVNGFHSERGSAPSRIPPGVPWQENTGISETVLMENFAAVIRNRDIHFDDVVRGVVERYRYLVTQNREQYLEFFRALLAADGTPVLFHCSTGRDRTGVAAALLLLALGVSEHDIVDNYMLSLELIKQRYFPVVPAIRRRIKLEIHERRPAAVDFAEALTAGNTAEVDRIEAELLAAARQNVLRGVMQNMFAGILAGEGGGVLPKTPAELAEIAEAARRQTLEIVAELDAGSTAPEIQAIRDGIEAAFTQYKAETLELGQMPEDNFDVWVENFARNAGNNISPLLSVFPQWIGAAITEVRGTWDGMEGFLDGVTPDMSGAEVVARLRELYLEPAPEADGDVDVDPEAQGDKQ